MASVTAFSEDQFGKKLDRCITDTLVKAGGGFLIGSVVSLLFFKRRAFPLWLGTGFGFGFGYRNCETALNSNEKF
ncbi:MICOS complex subunit Mic10-like [Sitodiplosis mosellana]|uniref:MICOS complex subunit Mic10-like n=1 Tax=Sitodiplosis mosellana TaxID=263140 RepID=UPI002444535C|nr:MICOS complex subunit Mic10-like [Sitodiplosis mosellana]